MPAVLTGMQPIVNEKVTTVRIDTTPDHAVNSFIPDQALGTSMDILPYGVVDQIYTEPILKQSLTGAPSFVTSYFDVTQDSPLADFEREAPRHPVFRLNTLS